MSAHSEKLGTLYLVPTPLDFGIAQDSPAPAGEWLPAETLGAASRITHWVTENAKSTRAFLKRVEAVAGLAAPLQAQTITELPRVAHKKGDHAPQADNDAPARALLAPALSGHDVGLVSEAGMPAIADPGSSVVRAAHAMGLRVVPLTGPISLMLALAASGLNGQSFAFVGYVPQEATERAKRLRELEAVALKTGQTQILIETPYRNTALLQALLQGLHPHTRLAVCGALSLPQQVCRSALVGEWKRERRLQDSLPLAAPCVFLLGR
ncbi:SAM-dependent methyltransferase [Hydrogenophaga palleronii]|uniref:SAM-dependent methyltransferase n=1 Tax=Hydrogenophaga palleronii TaxID=65655 RepID=UPI00082674B3|nr:SAM-dependent methyltransferase [Hydrogenophaga palleronii]